MYSITRTRFRGLIVVLALAIAGWSATSLWGQAIYGSIYGQVTDSSGAAVANATVTVKNVTKGTSVQVTTTAIGEYSVEHLIPDVYDVAVAATGFRGTESKGIRVSADTSPKVSRPAVAAALQFPQAVHVCPGGYRRAPSGRN